MYHFTVTIKVGCLLAILYASLGCVKQGASQGDIASQSDITIKSEPVGAIQATEPERMFQRIPTQQNRQSQRKPLMTNSTMQKAEQLALKGDAQQVTQLIQELANADFLDEIDPTVQANTAVKVTDNLTLLLRHLFSRKDIAGITDSVLWLAQQPAFGATSEPGTFRHAALVEASGSAQVETAHLLAFLQTAITQYDGGYQQYAVKALAQLGSKSAVSMIWQHIYSEQSALNGVEKEVFTKHYTGWLGVYRDRPAVLYLLVNHIYTTSAKQLVLTVLAEDVFKAMPDPEFRFPMAALDQSTENAVQLAVILAKWFIFNAKDIGPAQYQQKIAQRIVDLVGAQVVDLDANSAVELRKWVQTVFDAAKAQTQDEDRIALLAAGLNEILTSTAQIPEQS